VLDDHVQVVEALDDHVRLVVEALDDHVQVVEVLDDYERLELEEVLDEMMMVLLALDEDVKLLELLLLELLLLLLLHTQVLDENVLQVSAQVKHVFLRSIHHQIDSICSLTALQHQTPFGTGYCSSSASLKRQLI